MDGGLHHGFPPGQSVQPSNVEADNVERTAALMASYRDIELASPVLAASAREVPVDPPSPPPVLLRAVAGKTDTVEGDIGDLRALFNLGQTRHGPYFATTRGAAGIQPAKS